ncbi:hypothetical protein HO173_003667 [Letharia columbiana]|uniref:Uncharacterized protein n=1 Tax=Letharia columbiana TaxID=112416 RepID=A0A8H6L780_9LECA|nr:uncharacterized protein HO173_003667 [Letharia columbiana]KAF6238033.1 hypothetical protein HO173_003667 [Letharia columbiana]
MDEPSLDDLLKGLSDSALTIKNFVDDNEDLHHIQRSNKELQQAKQTRVANSLHKVRKHANALFRAIACGWSRQCHERHRAMLRLEPRCQEAYHALQSPSGVVLMFFAIRRKWELRSEIAAHRRKLDMFEGQRLPQKSQSPGQQFRILLSPLVKYRPQKGERTMSLDVVLEERRQLDPEDRIKLAVN